jgi:hypothetical protein
MTLEEIIGPFLTPEFDAHLKAEKLKTTEKLYAAVEKLYLIIAKLINEKPENYRAQIAELQTEINYCYQLINK